MRTRLLVGLLAMTPFAAQALDLGIEGLLSFESSDNIDAVNAGLEERGSVAFGQIGLFGEQRSRRLAAQFTGELDTRRRTHEGDDFDTVSRFLGAAEAQITPRSLSWYAGDVLGGVRLDNGLQTLDDTELRRRNVFVTGPEFRYEISSFSRTRARLLYINQSEEGDELETLYDASGSWERDLAQGSLWGVDAGYIYTQRPDDAELFDFDRSSLGVYWQHERARLTLDAGLGVTRYTTEDEALNSINARFGAVRQLTRVTAVRANLSRDLRDQSLTTIESLIDDGMGIEPEVDGFYDETRLELGYVVDESRTALDVYAGAVLSDYRLLGDALGNRLAADAEDQRLWYAGAAYGHGLSSRWRSELDLRYESQDFDNRSDHTRSIIGSAALIYQLARNWKLEGRVLREQSDGLRTRIVGESAFEELIDVTENRVRLGVRWAPLSRANQDLTVELKSLLR